MRPARWLLCLALAACSSPHVGPPWLSDARVLVPGVGITNTACRDEICQHNENVDVITWHGAIYLVHRTAVSQVLGPNCSLFVYRSTDQGKTFTRVAHILGTSDRDLRDPHFFTIGDELWILGNARLPVMGIALFDTQIDAVGVAWHTADGLSWSPGGVPWDGVGAVMPHMWTPWRPKQQGGVWYSAVYHDGDSPVTLFSSTDGASWTQGPDIYAVEPDHPEETELVFMPSGALLALVRMDGTVTETLGDQGRLRTKVCWSQPPYSSFDCPQELSGQRLDGPLAFFWGSRLFVVARKHLQSTDVPKKRTSLFEITGDFLNAGVIDIKEWGELPSAGDTAYAGATFIDDHRVLVSWYSGDRAADDIWLVGILSATDIWQGVIDLAQLR